MITNMMGNSLSGAGKWLQEHVLKAKLAGDVGESVWSKSSQFETGISRSSADFMVIAGTFTSTQQPDKRSRVVHWQAPHIPPSSAQQVTSSGCFGGTIHSLDLIFGKRQCRQLERPGVTEPKSH